MKSRKEQFLDYENVRLLEAQIQELIYFYTRKYQVSFPKPELIKNALIKTIRYYKKYLEEFNCRVSSIDFYKSYPWLGYFLAKELQGYDDVRSKILNVVLWRCEKELKNRHLFITQSDTFFPKLLKLLQNELDNYGEFGVGKNGFYMIMKAFSLVDKKPS